jgi:hypothetical protein
LVPKHLGQTLLNGRNPSCLAQDPMSGEIVTGLDHREQQVLAPNKVVAHSIRQRVSALDQVAGGRCEFSHAVIF